MAIASTAPAEGLFWRGIFTGVTPLVSTIGPGPCDTQAGALLKSIDSMVRLSSCSSVVRRCRRLVFLRDLNRSVTGLTSDSGRACDQRLSRFMGCSPDVNEGPLHRR